MIGAGRDTRTVLAGFAMVFLSLLALPALMRLFSWTAGQVADSAGGGGFLQTALGGAVAIGALRGSAGGSGGSSAVEQARLVSARLGPQASGPDGAAPPGGGVRQMAASADASAGAAAGGPAASAGAAAGAGPVGLAATGLAAGAATVRRRATGVIQPPPDAG
jgi:type IV secretion system protein TrbL